MALCVLSTLHSIKDAERPGGVATQSIAMRFTLLPCSLATLPAYTCTTTMVKSSLGSAPSIKAATWALR